MAKVQYEGKDDVVVLALAFVCCWLPWRFS
jgi:hypothetical protein